jgi:type I restriction enzyme, R subunit
MSNISKPERATQNRVIDLFRQELHYDYLGNWQDRSNNSNIEETYLTAHLTQSGYTPDQISRALQTLRTTATNPNRSLYDNNKALYALLYYGIQVKTTASEATTTIALINWQNPEKNHFAIAEEVTIQGKQTKRPDLVLYLNGIAIGLIELKNSRITIGDGIRQSLTNQKPEFIESFFSTIQIIFAGNDSEGLRYGTIGTEEKYFLTWKEDEQDNSRYKLDKYLLKLCDKTRLLDLLQNFILFDAGIKKLPRVHQYFGIKAAQPYIQRRQGGIIWHTQGSGKSITMVLLAKWILANHPNARIAIVTDRTELDQQIHDVFIAAGETIYRTRSGRDLMAQLSQPTPRLLCSLVHKFGQRNIKDKDFEQFIQDLESQPSPTIGDIFVFVDECHRTQSGKLHRTMKALMPTATFIGFTGTPLLKQDAQTSLETFGQYIHTYKFSEAVEDKVVLDLIYEARDIDQTLGSETKIDAWFDAKTKGLNDWQKATLREKWGTMQKVLSSRSRIDRVVEDITFDFSTKPRLSNDRGNAMLVVASIYEACKYYERFQKTPFKGKCAIITSYNPQTKDITTEDTGANTETDKQFIYNLYSEITQDITPLPNKTKAETYELAAKDKFKTQPANMKLLIVVDKLLTGFDAPSCTYLYIDKSMQDHGLFQAICRTNRLDGDDKDFGYIVDYKDLFKKVENAIAVYTAELDHSDGGADPEVLLQDRLTKGRERLDDAIEALHLLCEPVQPPRDDLAHIRYFCGNTEIPDDLKATEPQRTALYKATATLLRCYASIADELETAGYSTAEIARIKYLTKKYTDLREVIRKASGETLDLKPYEADMRHLIDTYIEASEPRKISPFDDMPLLEIITKVGINRALEELPQGIRSNQKAVAETIENNVRRKIIKENLSDPAYYAKMSALLDEIIEARKQKAIEYEEYLQRIAELVKKVELGQDDNVPTQLDTPGKRAIYNILRCKTTPGQAAEAIGTYTMAYDTNIIELALKIDQTIKYVRPDDWRDNDGPKEQRIKAALYGILQDAEEVERIFPIVKQQSEY